MRNNIVDLACYRAAKKRAERTRDEEIVMVPCAPLIDESDGFSREELVDLRKIFQEE